MSEMTLVEFGVTPRINEISQRLRSEKQEFMLDEIESRYNASFVGHFPLKMKNGMWSEFYVPVFYVENPDESKGHTNYFAMARLSGQVYICNAAYVEDLIITAVVADDGEVLYSRSVHDFVVSKDETVWIDGGFDYTRYSAFNCPINLVVRNGQFELYKSEETNET